MRRISVVTGAASGIGRATAAALRDVGDLVIGLDLQDSGTAAQTLLVDLTDEAQIAQAMTTIASRHGTVGAIVNSAGIAGFGQVHELALADWHRVIAVQLTAAMLVCKHALPLMFAGGGSIVNVASVYGMTGGGSNIPYNVAKGGILQLTRSMAADYAARQIRVNAVSPGYIETPMSAILKEDELTHRAFAEMHLLRRAGRPEEVAAAASCCRTKRPSSPARTCPSTAGSLPPG